MVRKRTGPVALALFLIHQKRNFLPVQSVPCVLCALCLSHKHLQLLRVMRW